MTAHVLCASAGCVGSCPCKCLLGAVSLGWTGLAHSCCSDHRWTRRGTNPFPGTFWSVPGRWPKKSGFWWVFIEGNWNNLAVAMYLVVWGVADKVSGSGGNLHWKTTFLDVFRLQMMFRWCLRYVRILCETRATPWGCSILELQVFPAFAGLFHPVDGGDSRACRGSSRSDNSPSHYTVFPHGTLKGEGCRNFRN